MTNEIQSPTVQLRDVEAADLPIFFEQERDPVAIYMAAFTAKDPNDRAAFDAHWRKIMNDESIINKTILVDGQVAGNIATFVMFDEREVSYWLDQRYWGKGFATRALTIFLSQVPMRPLYARAAKDNIGSIRVLQKCGFVITGEDKGFANARGQEIEEYIFTLAES